MGRKYIFADRAEAEAQWKVADDAASAMRIMAQALIDGEGEWIRSGPWSALLLQRRHSIAVLVCQPTDGSTPRARQIMCASLDAETWAREEQERGLRLSSAIGDEYHALAVLGERVSLRIQAIYDSLRPAVTA